ncbi:MAG TPA: outer membrane beta-barrel protein [Steroidobacteraceae bacterium]
MTRIISLAAITVMSIAAMPLLADANQGLYVGGGVGSYGTRIDNAAELGSTIDHYSATDTAYKVFGGWRFMPFLSIEASYINLGTNTRFLAPGVRVKNVIDGWAPTLTGTLPLGPFELFVSGGDYFYRYRQDVDTPIGGFYSQSRTLNHLIYSGGAGVTLFGRLPIRLEYQRFEIQNTDRSNALWLTAAYRF